MSRTRVRRHRVVCGLIGLSLAAAFSGPATSAFGTQDEPSRRDHRYVVQAGDTLWEIAEREAGATQDPRPLVDAIADANDVDTAQLIPGETLVVPDTA